MMHIPFKLKEIYNLPDIKGHLNYKPKRGKFIF